MIRRIALAVLVAAVVAYIALALRVLSVFMAFLVLAVQYGA